MPAPRHQRANGGTGVRAAGVEDEHAYGQDEAVDSDGCELAGQRELAVEANQFVLSPLTAVMKMGPF
jgi:hypothetical protein